MDSPGGKPRVLLYWDATGMFHFMTELGAEVICVDERCDERVYVAEGYVEPELIDDVIAGEDPIDAANKRRG